MKSKAACQGAKHVPSSSPNKRFLRVADVIAASNKVCKHFVNLRIAAMRPQGSFLQSLRPVTVLPPSLSACHSIDGRFSLPKRLDVTNETARNKREQCGLVSQIT